MSYSTSLPHILLGPAYELKFQTYLHAHCAFIFILHIHSSTFKAHSAAESTQFFFAKSREELTYVTSVSGVRTGRWVRVKDLSQCHLSSRLGTKEVGASVPLPPSWEPLSLHNKVQCYIRGGSCTPEAGESSISL